MPKVLVEHRGADPDPRSGQGRRGQRRNRRKAGEVTTTEIEMVRAEHEVISEILGSADGSHIAIEVGRADDHTEPHQPLIAPDRLSRSILANPASR